MNYYAHPYVSNSDLTKLKKELSGQDQPDPTNAYRIGTLIDAVITTPELVDYISRTIIGTEYTYTMEEMAEAKLMRDAFMQDPFCASLYKISEKQKEVYVDRVPLQYNGIDFSLNMRCKPDFYSKSLGMAPDLKSTMAKTQQQFYDACIHFDYPRSRAVYMQLCGFKKDMLIGVSKVNYKVFKIPIVFGDSFHKMGVEQFQELAYKYWAIKL